MKRISVIIPVYNAEKYLAQCLDSILAQTYQNLEIICVDDGSTDGSLDILSEYRKKDLRVFVIRQNHIGVSQARNTGLQHAVGEVVAFVDADDYLKPDIYEKAMAVFTDDVDLVCFGTELVYEGVFREDSAQVDKNINALIVGHSPVGPVEATKLNGWLWNKLYRRSVIKEHDIGFVQGMHFREDLVYCLCFYVHARNMYGIKDKGYVYRRNKTSTTADKKAWIYSAASWMTAYGIMFTYYGTHNVLAEWAAVLYWLAAHGVTHGKRCIEIKKHRREQALHELKPVQTKEEAAQVIAESGCPAEECRSELPLVLIDRPAK